VATTGVLYRLLLGGRDMATADRLHIQGQHTVSLPLYNRLKLVS